MCQSLGHADRFEYFAQSHVRLGWGCGQGWFDEFDIDGFDRENMEIPQRKDQGWDCFCFVSWVRLLMKVKLDGVIYKICWFHFRHVIVKEEHKNKSLKTALSILLARGFIQGEQFAGLINFHAVGP